MAAAIPTSIRVRSLNFSKDKDNANIDDRLLYFFSFTITFSHYNIEGYEFDVGIHYIGEVGQGRLNRTLIEQISDGQIEWKKMEDAYDIGKKRFFVHFIRSIHIIKFLISRM